MTGAALSLSDWDEALTPLGYALPESGAVPALTEQIAELLRLDPGDTVIDLCSSEDPPSLAIRNEPERRASAVGATPFGERLARLVSASGVRTVQISALHFGRFAMRYDKVLVRGGFASIRDRGRPLLASLFERLGPKARFLVVDSAPSPDAPLFADGVRCWQHMHCPAATIARLVHEAGFATERVVVDCVRCVLMEECRAWIACRRWPFLETFSDTALEHGLRELRSRYGAQPMVTFTSRFEMVLGTKLRTAGWS